MSSTTLVKTGTNWYNSYAGNYATCTFEREGYTCDYWTVNSSRKNFETDTATAEWNDYNKIIAAKAYWTPITSTVTLDANGGTVDPTTVSATYDDVYPTLPEAEREGYNFLGWFTKAEDGEQIEAGDDVAITKATTLYAQWERITYLVTTTAGKHGTITEKKEVGYGDDFVITFTPDKGYMIESVEVDGNEVDPENYTLESGSTVVTLKNEYLATLESGTHKITAEYSNGNTAETEFTIEAEKIENPNTGDNILMYLTVGSISLIGLAVAGLYISKKRKFN